MTQQVTLGSVTPTGVGKSDYSAEVSLGQTRPGIALKYGQQLSHYGLVFSTEIQFVVLSPMGYTNCVPADIGKMVVDDGANTAVLSAYNNATGIWQIGWTTPVVLGSVMTITAGVGNGIAVGSVLNPYPHVIPPLAVGATTHVVDLATGLPSPLPVAQGYAIQLISASEMTTEDGMAQAYIGTPPAPPFLAGTIGAWSSGGPYYENRIEGLTTKNIDPIGAYAHTIDVTITNLGGGPLIGGVDLLGIIEAIGTPPFSTVKTVRCKLCAFETNVPANTTMWVCVKCGQLNIFYDQTRKKI